MVPAGRWWRGPDEPHTCPGASVAVLDALGTRRPALRVRCVCREGPGALGPVCPGPSRHPGRGVRSGQQELCRGARVGGVRPGCCPLSAGFRRGFYWPGKGDSWPGPPDASGWGAVLLSGRAGVAPTSGLAVGGPFICLRKKASQAVSWPRTAQGKRLPPGIPRSREERHHPSP